MTTLTSIRSTMYNSLQYYHHPTACRLIKQLALDSLLQMDLTSRSNISMVAIPLWFRTLQCLHDCNISLAFCRIGSQIPHYMNIQYVCEILVCNVTISLMLLGWQTRERRQCSRCTWMLWPVAVLLHYWSCLVCTFSIFGYNFHHHFYYCTTGEHHALTDHDAGLSLACTIVVSKTDMYKLFCAFELAQHCCIDNFLP